MKHTIYILFISLILAFTACSKDDKPDSSAVCLSCEVVGESFGDPLCVGAIDPETGEAYTLAELEELELTKALFEAFGSTCTLK